MNAPSCAATAAPPTTAAASPAVADVAGNQSTLTFEPVLAAHAAMLARIAASYEANATARQDLVQDMAFALWRALPRWRQEGSLRSFVARIAHNCCVDHIARQSKHRHDDIEDEVLADATANPQHDAARAERYERLQQALRQLPLGQRQAVTLALEGFSHSEIAAALNITVNNADARISRARRALAKRFGEQS
ncbi:MAG TPA: sigma-70 family RNA polymerase sigma factor [Rhodanobacteraceae bacterium]